MTNPITPPPELIEQWMQAHSTKYDLARHAAQWGADQELEACKQYMHDQDWFMSPTLRMAELHNARRPKPPSLKEQALRELADAYDRDKIDDTTYDTIRRALKAQ